MIELKPEEQKTFFKQRVYRLKHSPMMSQVLIGCTLIYVASIIGFCALLSSMGRSGLIVLGLWLTLPLVYVLIRDLYIAWYMGNTHLLVSNATPQAGESIDVTFAQLFSQALTIETLTFDLIMHESRTGPNPLDNNALIQTVSQSNQPVARGDIYQTLFTLHIPPDARPNQKSPEDTSYDLHWLIRVTLKCQSVLVLTEDYPLVVVAESENEETAP